MDDNWPSPEIAPLSGVGQLLSSFSFLTTPVVVYTLLMGVALWALRRRLKRVAAASVFAAVLGYVGSSLLRAAFLRPRPESQFDYLMTQHGWSYPSGHVTAATVFVAMMIVISTTTRQSRRVIVAWRVGGGLAVIAVAISRWLLAAHWVSDLVGGVLLGLLAAALAVVAADVHYEPEFMAPFPDAESSKRCAIIVNPSKVTDLVAFRRHVEFEIGQHGWQYPLWLETTPSDPGHEMAQRAVAEGVDLVLVAGGDGTVRAVAGELVDTGIALGLSPAGTGNLLARNLGISRDENAALATAFTGEAQPIDLVRVTLDGDPIRQEFAAVMAGVGADADVMQKTRPDLKKAIGSGAYFLAAAESATPNPMLCKLSIDGGMAIECVPSLVLIGNVGQIQGGIQVMPAATAQDGLLDVAVASPEDTTDWLRLASKALAQTVQPDPQLERWQCRRVELSLKQPREFEIDGDVIGQVRNLKAEVLPGAIQVMLPKG